MSFAKKNENQLLSLHEFIGVACDKVESKPQVQENVLPLSNSVQCQLSVWSKCKVHKNKEKQKRGKIKQLKDVDWSFVVETSPSKRKTDGDWELV